MALAWWLATRGAVPAGPGVVPGERVPYTVEVLNGTSIDGLARIATFRLREAGIDVVNYGTADGPARDSTLVIVHGESGDAGATVRDALGFGRVVGEPDPLRLLDVTVVLGRDAAGLIAPER